MNAGEEGSHAVYPRASNVFLMPPLGKLEASGSCWTKSFPENFSITSPPGTVAYSINESCFSAVPSVRGWNQ